MCLYKAKISSRRFFFFSLALSIIPLPFTLASANRLVAPNAPRIAIEAGHSSSDPGAYSCDQLYKEADITYDIATRVAQKLAAVGYQVIVYRDNKSAFAGQTYAAYVALHVDYCPDGYVIGYKVGRYGGAAGTGLLGNGDASDRLTQALWDAYGTATGIQQDHSTGHYTTGFRYYFGLPGGSAGVSQSTAGAIIEMGWMRDPDLSVLLNQPDKVAQGIANGLLNFLENIVPGHQFCVNEGERCDFSGAADIAYGTGASFNYISGISGGVDCNNAVFGDPASGAPKACYIKGGGPLGYVYCIAEGGRCDFSGVADVAYGASLRYNYQFRVTGGIDCNNTVFGDPIYGTAKACYYKSLPPPAAPTDLQASDGDYPDQVSLTWSAPANVLYYQVYRAVSASSTQNLLSSPTAPGYADTNAEPGVTYYYWVKACNANGCSPFSSYDAGYALITTLKIYLPMVVR